MVAQYRTAAIILSRQSMSIRSTISEEMKSGMGAATWVEEADAKLTFGPC
jgi:hypothetical protein